MGQHSEHVVNAKNTERTENAENTEHAENTRTVYRELCTSYRAIDDLRMRLLGLLPLATAGGIAFLIAGSERVALVQHFLFHIGAFGFFVALGMFCFELYGIKKCHDLIEAGKRLEAEMRVTYGQFNEHTPALAGFINEPFAAGVIYPAVLATWVFLAWVTPDGPPFQAAKCGAMSVFVVGFAAALFLNLRLKNIGKESRTAAGTARH